MTHKFYAPIEFEGESITEIDLSGMAELTGQDLVDAQEKLPAASVVSVPVDTDVDFITWLLQKATGMPLEFFWALPDLEWNTLQAAALRVMLDAGEVPKEIPEEKYTARAMAKIQKKLTLLQNILNFPANNINYCLNVYAALSETPLEEILEGRAGTAMMIFVIARNHFFGLGRLAAEKSRQSSGATA